MKKKLFIGTLLLGSILCLVPSCDSDGSNNKNKEPVNYTAADIFVDDIIYYYYGVNEDETKHYTLAEFTSPTEQIERYQFNGDFHLKTKKECYISKISYTIIANSTWTQFANAYYLEGQTDFVKFIERTEFPQAEKPYEVIYDFTDSPKHMLENREIKICDMNGINKGLDAAKYTIYNFKVSATDKI